MYEHTPAPSVETFDIPDDTSDIRVRAAQSVEEIARDMPELAERHESIAESLQEFMTSQEVDASFLDDKLAGLVLCGVLDTLNQTPEDDQGSRDFLHSSLVVLAQTHSAKLKNVYRDRGEAAAGIDDVEKLRVYDKYTNQQMTKELQDAIDGGLLDGVKFRLGITEGNEDPYELRVMNLTTEYALTAFIPETIEWDDALSYSENIIAMDKSDESVRDVTQWKLDLERRSDEYMKLRGETHMPPAWVEKVNGVSIMAIPLTLAEKILSEESSLDRVYGKDDHASDMGMLEHEYTHTQNMHMPEGSESVGSLLEELRAEYFSGDKNGYNDLKAFARDFGVITGKDLVEYIQPGQSKYSTYTALARDIGVEGMTELALGRSQAYTAHESNEFNRTIDERIGGMDGISARLLERAFASGVQAQRDIEARVEESVTSKLSVMTYEDYEAMLEYAEDVFGLHTITALYKRALADRYQNKTAEPLSA